VLDSAGSVLPLWREQIARGGTITLTDPRCERYFMSIPDACELIVGAMELGAGTYVFDMGAPRRIADIAESLIASSGMQCEIEYIGLRPGEKLTEELFNGELSETTHPKIRRVRDDELGAIHMLDELRGATACRSTAEAVRLLGAIAA
jgi:FlaA1/EpsC-like NDP-sugar epimerase